MSKSLGPNVVETTAGKIRGDRRGRLTRFRGIPYGAAVGSEFRFRPARPASAWAGVLDTLELGPACPQNRNSTMGLFALPEIQALVGPAITINQPTDENCLKLNVWTPALAKGTGKKPVMVWLHGGGFFAGSSGSPPYDAEHLSDIGDVVVVSLNHRINAFGFLYLGQVTGEGYATANVGLLDIVLALKWVRDNIAAFGGDPGNVTIFGESGGGAKVTVLGAMPAAKGLFHKAISQSGSPTTVLSPDAATVLTDKILKGAGLQRSEWKRLLELTGAQLVAATVADPAAVKLGPVADGVTIARVDLLTGPPIDGGTIPMIIGSTHDEARLLFAADQAAFSTDEAGLRARVAQLIGKSPDETDRLIAAYKDIRPGASAPDLFFEIATDIAMRNKAVQHADRRAGAGAKTYMYRFDWRSPLFGGKYGAVHGIDIPFVFNQPDSLGAVGPSPARFALAKAVSLAWARFSWTGNPNHPGLANWPQYSPSHRWTMLFNERSKAIEASPIIQPVPTGATK